MRQTQYGYLYVLAVACPATGQAEGMLAPYLNTDTINAFLRLFSAAIAPGVHAVLIWDGAGYHTSKRLEVPANVSLIQLPPLLAGTQSDRKPLALFAKSLLGRIVSTPT